MNYKEYKQQLKEELEAYKDKIKAKLDEFKEKQNLKLEKFKLKTKNNKKISKSKSKRRTKGGALDSQEIKLLETFLKALIPDFTREQIREKFSAFNINNISIDVLKTDFTEYYTNLFSKKLDIDKSISDIFNAKFRIETDYKSNRTDLLYAVNNVISTKMASIDYTKLNEKKRNKVIEELAKIIISLLDDIQNRNNILGINLAMNRELLAPLKREEISTSRFIDRLKEAKEAAKAEKEEEAEEAAEADRKGISLLFSRREATKAAKPHTEGISLFSRREDGKNLTYSRRRLEDALKQEQLLVKKHREIDDARYATQKLQDDVLRDMVQEIANESILEKRTDLEKAARRAAEEAIERKKKEAFREQQEDLERQEALQNQQEDLERQEALERQQENLEIEALREQQQALRDKKYVCGICTKKTKRELKEN